MYIFESQYADWACIKWNFSLFETKCHALAINYLDLDILESQQADLAWIKLHFSLFETKCHALAINYFRVGHVWVTTCRFSMK